MEVPQVSADHQLGSLLLIRTLIIFIVAAKFISMLLACGVMHSEEM